MAVAALSSRMMRACLGRRSVKLAVAGFRANNVACVAEQPEKEVGLDQLIDAMRMGINYRDIPIAPERPKPLRRTGTVLSDVVRPERFRNIADAQWVLERDYRTLGYGCYKQAFLVERYDYDQSPDVSLWGMRDYVASAPPILRHERRVILCSRAGAGVRITQRVAEIAMDHMDSDPFAPKVYDIRSLTGGGVLVEMELLKAFPYPPQDIPHLPENGWLVKANSYGGCDNRIPSDELMERSSFVRAVANEFKSWDLHSENYMRREDGHIVITDPVC